MKMKKTLFNVFSAVVLVGLLGACAARDVTYSRSYPLSYQGGLSDETGDIASAAAWDNAATITITHKDSEFSPMYVGLKKDTPYILKIVNEDDRTLSIRAANFFANSSVASISQTAHYSNDLPAIEKPLLKSFIVSPKGEREVRVVPMGEGSYEFDNGYPAMIIGEFQFAPWSRAASMGTVGAIVVK